MNITTIHRSTQENQTLSSSLYDVNCGGFTAGIIITTYNKETGHEEAYVRFLDHEENCTDMFSAINWIKARAF